jgi:tRNA-splicing ligase RtcB
MPIKGILSKARVPIKIWSDLSAVESGALEQLTNTANLPFVFKHVAAMPDVHLGKGATVGSVVATKGAICPAAVGVDIGCGMIAIKTDLDPRVVQDKVVQIRASIERSIPVGHNGNSRLTKSVEDWAGWASFNAMTKVDKNLLNRAKSQLGSLGGGNHFIEVCLDSGEACSDCGYTGKVAGLENVDCSFCKGTGVANVSVWVMLHSGSRNIGKTQAEKHMDVAKGLMKKLFINLPDPELSYLAEQTPEFDAYMADLNWCQDYALQSREEMLARVLKDLSYAVYGEDGKIAVSHKVNCHHNYASREHHFGENVLVTRKGAVRARSGDLGIIPGSMGTRSYIVRGLGNPDSFHSCSHGAGRRMSRGEAKRTFSLEDFAAQTAGVECRKDLGVLDEIPGAYKSIDEVMANQTDLVEVVAQLKQILCVKG